MALDRLDQNTSLYTLPEVDYVINEAVRTTSLFTGFFRNTLHLAGFTVADKLVYNTPAGMLVPILISFEGRQLQKTTLRNLARQRRNWATATTLSYGRVDYWASIGIGQFVINPIDSVGGNDLTITGLGEPPLLVNPTDVLVIENEYVELITAYCAHRMPLKVGGKIFADGSIELNEFYDKVRQRLRYESFKAPKYALLGPRQQAPPVQQVAP
jgi:hypothetical protein